MPQGYDGNTYNLAGTGGANTVTVSVTNNQAATNATNQSVTITGSIDNTSLTTAQLGSHSHNYEYGPNVTHPNAMSNSARPLGHSRGSASLTTGSAGSGTAHNHTHTLSGTLTGNITTSLTGTVTAAGTNSFSPYVVVNYIIKH